MPLPRVTVVSLVNERVPVRVAVLEDVKLCEADLVLSLEKVCEMVPKVLVREVDAVSDAEKVAVLESVLVGE